MEDYWKLLESIKGVLSEDTQRKIACEFSRIVWDDLDELGREALIVAENYADGKGTIEKCEEYQNRLQQYLSGDGQPSLYSPIIWALTESTGSYPMWYSAAIAGSNVVDLNRATATDLCSIVTRYLESRAEVLHTTKAISHGGTFDI
jgi:hypothetical protein